MKIKDILGRDFLVFDGAMGSLLQKRGLGAGELAENWNIQRREEIVGVHLEYLEAGANIIKTNTFGANRFKFPGEGEVGRIVKAGVENAAEAVSRTCNGKPCFVALDIGPTGKILKPFGDLDFEDAVSVFAEMVRAGKDGADLILIETMSDLYETKAAVLAAKENSDLPVFVTNAYEKSGKLMTGADPETVCAALEGLGVDAMGLNCSFGPEQMLPVVEKLARVCSVPVIVNPNAGLPDYSDGKATYSIDAEQFAEYMKKIIALGVHVVGGCCGTTPEYIGALCRALDGAKFCEPFEKNVSVVSSYNRTVVFSDSTTVIGEQINPDLHISFREALQNDDIDSVIDMGLDQEDEGVGIIAVNVGVQGTDEKDLMVRAITELQSVTGLPLRIDTCSPGVLEAALRIYNGKAMIGLANNGEECMAEAFPLIKKYGGTVVVPVCSKATDSSSCAELSEAVARIYDRAFEYGIAGKDVIVDIADVISGAGSIADVDVTEAMSAVAPAGELANLGAVGTDADIPSDTLCVLHFHKI